MTVISSLAEFVAQADASALSTRDQVLQRRHVLDTLVAAAAAARTGEGKSLAALFGAGALADVIGQSAATIRLSEIDDIHLPSCTTPSAAAVATALSLAAELGRCEPGRVASAIWAGTELMTRLGEAVHGPQILYRGIWPSCFAAPMAVAATAARMHDLDPKQTADALSLALMLSTRGSGRPHGSPSARWVMFAVAVGSGITAVEAVMAGYRGDDALLDGTTFEDTWGFTLDRERLTAATAGRSVYSALSIKPFCSAKQSIAAVEALRALLKSGIDPAAITALRVRVPKAYAGMIATKAQDGVRTTTLVSVARQLALLAHDPARLYDIDRSKPVADEAILRLERLVEIVPDPELTHYYPQQWPAEVEIEAAGKTLRERVIDAPGDPARPLDDQALDDKAHGVLDPLIGDAAAAELIRIGRRGLDDEAGCGALTATFVRAFATS